MALWKQKFKVEYIVTLFIDQYRCHAVLGNTGFCIWVPFNVLIDIVYNIIIIQQSSTVPFQILKYLQFIEAMLLDEFLIVFLFNQCSNSTMSVLHHVERDFLYSEKTKAKYFLAILITEADEIFLNFISNIYLIN